MSHLIRECIENRYSLKHHSLVNFSLMFVQGDLLRIKSKGIKNDRNEYEWLDRLDSFLYLLDNYYKGINESFIPNTANGSDLKNYLDKFGSVKRYSEVVYLIHNENLLKNLIINGGKPIKNKDDVRRYLDLADRFWEEKNNHINLN